MPGTYTNPVYPGYFADPFVLKVNRTYYAYGTGSTVGERAFEVLRSEDLVNWKSLGGALELVDTRLTDYWAPEVVLERGTFYMYYSAGIGNEGQQLRVATSDAPQGPFRGSAEPLIEDDPFTIDAHPFRDDDGQWYLYYARDFLDGERVGTALAVDRLLNMRTLEGNRRTVLRASSNWQLFEAQRTKYARVQDWYTIEGATVLKRDGRYYCLYSGGSWQKDSYGVSYAVADSPLGPFSEEVADEPTILQTVPGRVIGPGHNSIVDGPDGKSYIVYHAWDVDMTARRMCIDQLKWGPNGPLRSGPTYTPQPIPSP